MNKKAFTLVELIVVITILAVLATVAFISFQGYGQSARDSTRLSDMKSMEKLLDLSKLTNNRYPTPVNSTTVTYSGSVAWTQGVFGQTAYTGNASMSNVPVDPVTALEYPYSITANGQEYQLASVLENPVTSTIIPATYAGTQEAQVYVKGNYNGQFLKVKKDSTTYLLGVPSILTSDIVSSQLLEDILTNNRLVYNGHKNLPSSFSGSVYKTDGGFDFGGAPYVASDMILFVGDTSDLETDPAQRVALLDKLQASYSGSVIKDVSTISELLSVDSSSAGASSNYVATALNNSLKTSIVVTEVSSGGSQAAEDSPSCPSSPNPDSDFDFDSGSNTITDYTGGGFTVVIPCTIAGVDVLHISYEAFAYYDITSITFPNGLLSIGEESFAGNLLESIIIPNSVTTIGDVAFEDNLLTSVTIGDSVTYIGYQAFSENQLTSITIPDSVISIGSEAFAYNQLASIIIPNNVTTIDDDAFTDNLLTSVTIGNSVESIGDYAFYGNQIESITIPDSVTSIGEQAFEDNELTNVIIGDGVLSIGDGAFHYNQITSLTIGNSVTSIGADAFRVNQIPSVTIPSSVTSIGEYAFYANKLEANTIVIITCGSLTFGIEVFFTNGPAGLTDIPNPACL